MAKNEKYAHLDSLILQRIEDGPVTFSVLRYDEAISKQADAVSKPDRYGSVHGWRTIDRRLQSLRKAGRIQYAGGAWMLHL